MSTFNWNYTIYNENIMADMPVKYGTVVINANRKAFSDFRLFMYTKLLTIIDNDTDISLDNLYYECEGYIQNRRVKVESKFKSEKGIKDFEVMLKARKAMKEGKYKVNPVLNTILSK